MKTMTTFQPTRKILAASIVCILQACANDPHSIGLKQLDQGATAEGLENLRKANQSSPANLGYRSDYLKEKDRQISRLLYEANGRKNNGQLSEAENLYQSISIIDPENPQAKAGLLDIARLKRHNELISDAKNSWSKGDHDRAIKLLQSVLIENPNNAEANDMLRRFTEERIGLSARPGVIPALGDGYKQPVSLQFRDANLKMILESVSKTTGINILVDKEVKNDLKATIFVQKASVEDTINLLLMQNQLERRIINENTIYIYPATPAKLKEQQDLIVRVFQLVNADAKQMQSLLKTVLKVKESFVNEKANSLIIRDTPEVAALAAKLLASQDVAEPEVMLEVEVIEIARTAGSNLGLTFPDQVGLSTKGTLSYPAFRNLTGKDINVSGNASDGGFSLLLKMHSENGDVDILASPKIRVRQHEKAKVHIGDRIPMFTNNILPQATLATTSIITSAIQYIETGIKLEVEPDIHPDGEVAIKTVLEVSTLGAKVTDTNSNASAYQIGMRTASTVLRLKDGETQILAGLLNSNERNTTVKVPGIGDIPVLGRMFSSANKNRDKTEIVLAITPRIVRNIRQPDAELSSYWSGTDSSVKVLPVMSGKTDSIRADSEGASPFLGTRIPRSAIIAAPAPAPSTAVENPATNSNPQQPAPSAPEAVENANPAGNEETPAPQAPQGAPIHSDQPQSPGASVSPVEPSPVAITLPESAQSANTTTIGSPSINVTPGVQTMQQQIITDAFRVAPRPMTAAEVAPPSSESQ